MMTWFTHLVFVQLTVDILLLTLRLEGDNHKTDKDVHHEECDNNQEDEVEEGDEGSCVVLGSVTLLPRVD